MEIKENVYFLDLMVCKVNESPPPPQGERILWVFYDELLILPYIRWTVDVTGPIFNNTSNEFLKISPLEPKPRLEDILAALELKKISS